MEKRRLQSTINLDAKALDWVHREIVGAYIAGSDKIILDAKRISPEQNKTIRHTIQGLFGFEILEETSTIIVAQSVVDDSLFPVGESTRRVFAICRSMLADSLQAARTGDKELANDVILRDQEVNKLVYAIERRFVQVLKGRADGSANELNFYCNVSMQLERIGDRAVIIGKLVSNNHTDQVRLSNSFPTIHEAITELLDDIEALLKDPSINLAHQVLDKNPRLEPLMYSSGRIKQTYEGAVVEDSFDRSRGRLMNIAELTIDYLMQS
jgi:phosphate uptake regulator